MNKFREWIVEVDTNEVWDQLQLAVHNKMLIRAQICIDELVRRVDEDVQRTQKQVKEIRRDV